MVWGVLLRGVCVVTHRDAGVFIEQNLQQVRRQDGRRAQSLLCFNGVRVLMVRSGRRAGDV